jgi:MOSC domain-containing protein YiiM
MGRLVSVNRSHPFSPDYTNAAFTGIDKRPVEGPVSVTAPGPRASGNASGSALAGDVIGDRKHHGGDDQAVYAYAREDLDRWAKELDRELRSGVFGENLTTLGVEVTEALVGERWRVGDRVLLEVTSCRIPCRTFAGWLGEKGWVKRFTREAASGAYLRVIEPGEIRAGDAVEVVLRPSHDITVGRMFRAMTTEPDLLPGVLSVGSALNSHYAQAIRHRLENA